MNYGIIVVFAVLALAVILFTKEKIPVDLTALIIMAALLLAGIITPAEGIAGFSNTATVTVGAMFVLSSAIFKTGALNFVEQVLSSVFKKNFTFGFAAMLLIVAVFSAFINTTAVVALFMPVVISIAVKLNINPSKLLIPLSFGALLGGVNTLIGTSTNILVSSIAKQHGLPSFGMFEMAPLGLIILAAGILYLLFIGIKILPDRKNPDAVVDRFNLRDYITEIILLENAKSLNQKIKDSYLVKEVDIDIIEIRRGNEHYILPSPNTVLLENDILKVRCNIDKLKELQKRAGIKLKSEKQVDDKDLILPEARLVEVLITHNSRLRGATLQELNFRETYGATVIAMKQRGKAMKEKLARTILLPGDVLLVEVKNDWMPRFRQIPDFIIISETINTEIKKNKIIISLIIMASVILTAAFDVMPIVQSAIIGSIFMVLSGCITLEEAYKSINWKVIFLLAGVLTLGLALEKTGGAALIAGSMVSTIGRFGNTALVSAFFFLTLCFTNFISNNATAALLAPIAILTAESLGVSSRPFLMAVTFAASLSFITPVGYQTNTMVMVPGNYKFMDYVKVGGPLDLILWILVTIFITSIFPF